MDQKTTPTPIPTKPGLSFHRRLLRIATVLAVTLAAPLFIPSAAVQAEEALTGLEIMTKNDRALRSDTEHQVMKMTLQNSRGQQRIRTIEGWSLEVNEDEERRFSKFLEPSDVEGTTLLYYDYTTKDDDTWLYLPALKKVKRILSTNKKDYFMGSDFTYEDMENIDLVNWDYTLNGIEEKDGVKCYAIEGVPNNDDERDQTAYSRVRHWVGTEDFISRHTEFYDKKERLAKVLRFEDIRATSDTDPRPRAHKFSMDNLITKHKTELAFSKIELDVEVDDDIFSQRNLRQ